MTPKFVEITVRGKGKRAQQEAISILLQNIKTNFIRTFDVEIKINEDGDIKSVYTFELPNVWKL